jgi:hypothetical protein
MEAASSYGETPPALRRRTAATAAFHNPMPAAGAVDEEPPVGMALSGPPSEGPQAAVHGMALSGPPSEGSQAAVHDEPEEGAVDEAPPTGG